MRHHVEVRAVERAAERVEHQELARARAPRAGSRRSDKARDELGDAARVAVVGGVAHSRRIFASRIELAQALLLGADVRGERLGRAADRLGALGEQARAHLGLLERLRELRVELRARYRAAFPPARGCRTRSSPRSPAAPIRRSSAARASRRGASRRSRRAPRSLPALMWGRIATTLENISCTWPESRSVSAGDRPLYGTWTMSTPAIESNITAASCEELPLPFEAKLSCPGARARRR